MESELLNDLYHVFAQVMRYHYHRAHMLLENVGIYPGQPPMLFALAHRDGQSQKELAEKLGIRPATITVMLRRMEKAQLVVRRQDPDDQRVSRVYLTERGREVYRKVDEVMRSIASECFSGFTAEEQASLLRSLSTVRDNLMRALGRESCSS